uniref:Gag-Pol polyprotein n=1 Tax=Tanacetum cinerariifolium TaxID=118510 RepID=A0A699JEN6_TANCI|nr:hypothetical protein [Tanacetum cinerariifolium]
MALVLISKAFKLNYSTSTNNSQRISSNPRNRQIAQPYQNRYNAIQIVRNQTGNGNVVAARAEGNAENNGNQIRKRQGSNSKLRNLIPWLLQEIMMTDEIEEVNTNCISMANLQQASTSGNRTDSAAIYDSDGSAKYTELLEPIPESHQVPHNDNDVISKVTSVEQSGETVEQHLANFEETRESIKSYYHRFLKLMNGLKKNKHFSKKIANNLKFMNNLQPEWSRHVTIVHQTKDLHTTDYTQLYDFLKYNQKEVDELKAERLAKIQDPLELMANSNNPYAFPVPHQDQPSFNQNYMQQPMPNPEDITDPTIAMNMALALMAKAFKLNYLTPTNNNQRISSNPCNRQIAQPGMNMGQDRQIQMVIQNAVHNSRVQNIGNQNGLIGVQWNGNQNQIGNGNLVAARAEGNAAGQNENQIRVSAEVHDYENCDDNEILNMFTQEEQYTELIEPIPDQHQVPQNDNNIISEVTSMEQSGETVEQHPTNFEETRALYDSLYQNLAIEVQKVISVNHKLKETNADLTTELARFKNKKKMF